jgi:ATP-dependent helicase/nuclease subunit A
VSLPEAVLPYLPDGSPDPNLVQRQAATPEHMVWVGASAGSGKTKVLTDRVLRLLLPDPQERWAGAAPHRILCITFTKAAAAEMALRVAKRLENWAVCPEEKLTAELTSLFGTSPSAESLRAARRLFSEVLDAPGGLNILTIHSFCQSILGRFPLESQVTPGFSILEDQASRSLLSTVIRSFLMETNAQVKEPLARLAIGHSLDDLEKNILTVLGQSRELLEICSPYDTNEAFLAHIRSGLGLEKGIDDQTLVSNFLENLPEASLQAAVGVFCAGSKSYQTIGDSLRDWLRLPLNQRPVSLTAYKLIFLTTENTVRKLKNFGEDHPEILRLWEAEGQRFLDFEDKRRSLRIAQKTSDLLWVSHQILTEYNRRKKKINALDFNDLIIKTRGSSRTDGNGMGSLQT